VNFLYVFGRSYMKILSFVLFAIFMCVSTAHAQKWVRLAEFPEPTEELVGASAGTGVPVHAPYHDAFELGN
jgi:hypothetical protein